MEWVDSLLVWTQGVGYPVMLIAGVVGFFAAMVFIVGLGNIVYKWVLRQPLVSGSPEGGVDALDQSVRRPGATGDAGMESEAPSEEPGGLLGVVSYRSLKDERFVAAAGSHVYVFTEPLSEGMLGPSGLAFAPGPIGDVGAHAPNPIANGAVDGSGRYWIDDIPPGEYYVYCYNANHEDTGWWRSVPQPDPEAQRKSRQGAADGARASGTTKSEPSQEKVQLSSPWAYKPNVHVPPGGEVTVDFRFE